MSEKLAHYVATEPFEPLATEKLTPEQERFYRASQWKIMWWKFRRHRVAVISAWVLLFFYASILVSEPLKARVTSCVIDRLTRKNERPSDHAPVILELS